MSKFRVGDKVRYISDYYSDLKNKIGTVLDDSNIPYVEFNEPIELGHDAKGLGKNGYCFSLDEDELELVSESSDTTKPDSNSAFDKQTGDIRSYNVGDSNYADFKIQPWDIWLEYDLNPWDADIVKRVLRNKKSQSRKMDYEKIIHVCNERIRQIEELEK